MTEKDTRVYYEPQHNRWHTSFECGVIAATDDIELVLCDKPQPGWRPCTLCARVPESCD